MKTSIIVTFTVDHCDEVQSFLGKLAERVLPEAVGKAWASKVVTKAVAAELAEAGVAFPDPCVTIQHDGNTIRIATSEDDGRSTEVGSEDEDAEIEVYEH
jgi:hypothetical protein